jgi:hypothetical protein
MTDQTQELAAIERAEHTTNRRPSGKQGSAPYRTRISDHVHTGILLKGLKRHSLPHTYLKEEGLEIFFGKSEKIFDFVVR